MQQLVIMVNIENFHISIFTIIIYFNIITLIATAAAALSQAVFMTTSDKAIQYYSPNDLSSFQNKFNLFQQAATNNDPTYAINSCPDTACNEGNLDLQYIMGMGQGESIRSLTLSILFVIYHHVVLFNVPLIIKIIIMIQ